ncbi:MAG: ABC transporter substrate-binding protein [Gammaproteobacteria bacterium]|uniref:MlaC/ttg2D family ABC transporter substrate-binding protein n=1 Tax=Rhodoferax sp. TaxID=50421 RepID=UPI001834B648|nr:ABC transporter substrate-binding protein [Rhodoferax sp.]MBU3900623.1 ABC transporter substrate-binding protein [Gammaproteobacteria bacterium]MBA3057745.1 ABC transporter substrate-binding protein [Rhodoferax sp.]MBU3996714.1 ABC transporter substrate-binding protein [Gammaproteobacteria bacterium]MBU4081001.1 ABC transporter substrate-binding protein [Gammaproteobacteria bacterium]MBU4112059.1 ABC transporter substrate-binding protein [Gammaproteobacteria bacterium]
MKLRSLSRWLTVLLLGSASLLALPALAADEAANALIKRLSTEVLGSIKASASVQGGDVSTIVALVDTAVMPHMDFKRMTASAVGPAWRQASPQQQRRLQEEFKTLLVRTYAGAVAQVADLRVVVKPLRASPQDAEVVVRTEIQGRGDPVQLDYRLAKTSGDGAGWKIYNLNVMGVWLVETYRSQFAQEVNAKGVDGLIATLSERNKSNASKG